MRRTMPARIPATGPVSVERRKLLVNSPLTTHLQGDGSLSGRASRSSIGASDPSCKMPVVEANAGRLSLKGFIMATGTAIALKAA
jgi:hypothetical protein